VDEEAPLTLSREDLYELAWSKPISELSKDFGISAVALAKRCRRLGIPLPGRGYWARVDAGQNPYRPKLPEREPQRHDQRALTVAPLASTPSAESPGSNSSDESQDELWLNERIAFEKRPENAIVVEQPPTSWDPVVRIHRDTLRAEVKEVLASKAAHERFKELPQRRKHGTWDKDGWKWRSMMSGGQRLLDYHKPRPFRVTLETLERALAITNAMAIAGKARGFTLRNDEKDGRLAVVGHAAELQFRMTEQLQTKVRPSEWSKGEMQKYKMPTGHLRITITDGWREGPIVEDRGSASLETLLNGFFIAVYKAVVKQWRHARALKVCQEQDRLEELGRAERERIQAEKERKAAAERQKRKELSDEARRWQEAQAIRKYVSCVRSKATEGSDREGGRISDSMDDWVQWALGVADELDPTCARIAETHVSMECEAEHGVLDLTIQAES
jgi:hypothetical protein